MNCITKCDSVVRLVLYAIGGDEDWAIGAMRLGAWRWIVEKIVCDFVGTDRLDNYELRYEMRLG